MTIHSKIHQGSAGAVVAPASMAVYKKISPSDLLTGVGPDIQFHINDLDAALKRVGGIVNGYKARREFVAVSNDNGATYLLGVALIKDSAEVMT